MKKTISILICITLFIFSCNKSAKKYSVSKAEDYKEYITAFTPSYIKSMDDVRIVFGKKAVDTNLIGTEVGSDIFFIQSNLSGKAVWLNEYTISFKANKEDIKRGTIYTARTNLKKIFPSIPDSLSWFNTNFQYLSLTLSIDWDFLRADDQHEGMMKIEGILSASDEISEISKVVKASIENGPSLDVQLSKSEGSNIEYHVVVDKIPRSTNETALVLEYKKDPAVDASLKSQTMQIPQKDKFVVTGIKEDRNDQRCLMVYFSDFLDPKQDLKGLIRVNKDSIKSSLSKDKDIVHVSFNTDDFRTGVLTVDNQIKNVNGKLLDAKFTHMFDFEQEKPKVRIPSSGNIVPSTDKIIFPFEAINLSKVDIEIFKVFSNNVLYNMHLRYSDEDNLTKLGRVIHREQIDLQDINTESNKSKWISYGLDLTKMVKLDPGSLYEVRILFLPQYSDYLCNGVKLKELKVKRPSDSDVESNDDSEDFNSSYFGYSFEREDDSNESESCYEEENPCCRYYYSYANFARRSFLASNIALTYKYSKNQNESIVLAYDVLTAKPLNGVEINVYDRQLQVIANERTNGSGIAKLNFARHPAYVTAKNKNEFAYLKIDDSKAITTSEFDISGVSSQHGLKASIYTERGVWRPGDSIQLNIILNQESNELPNQFPIQIELKNPKNQLVFQQKIVSNIMGLYACKIPTMPTWITGQYNASLYCGPSVFQKSLSIENVKPNRFKCDWQITNDGKKKSEAILAASFLHGAPASNKKINVDIAYSIETPKFKKFSNYDFDDPQSKNESNRIELVNSTLDESGKYKVDLSKVSDLDVNGILNYTLISKIMDAGGDLSTDYYSGVMDLNNEYVGIQMPSTYYPNYYPGNQIEGINVICVDKAGNPLANKQLDIDLYSTNWDWWYEIRNNNSYYSNSNVNNVVENKVVKTDGNGRATLSFKVEKYHNYYIQVRNQNSNHSCGALFYTGWTYDNNSKKNDYVQVMNIKPEKEKYAIGERGVLNLPGAPNGTYVIHLIRDNRILKTEVIKAGVSKTEYSFTLTPEMFPNIYVDVNLIQGLSNKKNDLPLRLYGLTPVMVENESLRLMPVIKMDEKVRPDQDFKIEVSEAKSATMAYQLMIVDEGLLNLTRFKTPDPYRDMFQKEALTLMTWDNYDQFMGNELSVLQKVFTIGGDEKLSAEDIAKLQRFKPVAITSGPQKLAKGEKRIHSFNIKNYLGAVRVMLIANNYNAFGSSEKSVVVRNELATQITFPRVCSISDQISVPVTVFKYEDNIKSANVNIQVTGPCNIVGASSKSVDFGNLKEKTVWFDLKPNGSLGEAKIECKANSGNYNSQSNIQFYIDNPNPISTQVSTYLIESGKSQKITLAEYGMSGTQKVKIEVSTIPELKSQDYLTQLIQYPHGCVEQTTSAAFPQLYLADYMQLTDDQRKFAMNNVASAISKLSSFQCSNGGMSYWPGNYKSEDYCSSYVTHFMAEAKQKSFQVNGNFLNQLLKYQASESNSFVIDIKDNNSYKFFLQAYRLYSLACHNVPEWGAMNRLKQAAGLGSNAKWMLAGAYALAGKKEIANQLVQNLAVDNYGSDYYDYSYGSTIRDMAFESMILNDIGKRDEAFKLLYDAVKNLNKNSYPNTQELASVMSAIGKVFKMNVKSKQSMQFNYNWNGAEESISSPYSIFQKDVNSKSSNQFVFTNNSSLPLNVNIIQSGKIKPEEKVNKSNGIKLELSYYKKGGGVIDLANLKQGDQFIAKLIIKNVSNYSYLRNIALTAVFPSGFEIENTRIGGVDNLQKGVDYQDYKDDRVMFYFNLYKNNLELNIPLTASYAGTYLCPLILCEAMYNPSINAIYRNAYVTIK